MSEKLKSEMQEIYDDCSASWSEFNEEAMTNLDFYMSAQFGDTDQKNAIAHNRSLLVMNKIKRTINLISGYEQKNRHILKISPVGREDDDVSRQLTSCVMQCMNYCDGYDYISDAFKYGNLVTGSNLLVLWRDRNGTLKLDRIGHTGFLLDSGITKTDLSDCSNILTGKWLPSDRIQMLLPTKDIPKPTGKISARWEELINPYTLKSDKMQMYEEWWHREVVYKPYLIHRLSGQEISFDDFKKKFANNDKNLANLIIESSKLPNGIPAITRFKKPLDQIKLDVYVDDEAVWSGINPLNIDDFPFIWMHGEFCAEHPRSNLRLQGMVQALRDPQVARNRRVNQAIDIIESTLQGHRMIRDKFFKNPERAYESGQGVVLHLDDNAPVEAPLDNFFRQFSGVEPGAGTLALMESLDKDTVDVSGLNDEIFGTDDKDIPAILSKFRTGQALTGQQGVFNDCRASKKRLGILMVKAIQSNYDPSRVSRMINENPLPNFYEPDLTRYDCMPVEGLLTDNQQSMFYEELKFLRMTFPDMASVITPIDLIKAAPIQFKKELLELISQRQKSQEQQAQVAMQNQERMNQLVEAQTRLGLSQTAENIEDAKAKRADTAFTRAKTAAEINKLQSEPVLNLLDRAIQLENIKEKQNGM